MKIRIDKVLHFVSGFFLTAGMSWFVEPERALLIAVCLGALKELYDGISENGTPEIWDLIATMAGGLVAYGGVKYLS